MNSDSSPRIYGTGLIALDVVTSWHPEVPIRCWTGGTCGNVLCILSWLGWDAYPIARMSSDAASERIRQDMGCWGVHLDWTSCAPTTHTPMVVQEILLGGESRPRHRFSWTCPQCGNRLPSFKPITVASAESVKPKVSDASVFFFDRPSRGILDLAAEASSSGAVVVFEPSGRADGKLVAEAISLAHVVKYAHGRSVDICSSIDSASAPLLEVHTLGERGLKYRHRLGQGDRVSKWIYQKPFRVARLADACGSGDWCTAGLIAMTAGGGQGGLRRVGARGVRGALIYGQALAAWNCTFEGARGGMYTVDRAAFDSQVNALISYGCLDATDYHRAASSPREAVRCPACSTLRTTLT